MGPDNTDRAPGVLVIDGDDRTLELYETMFLEEGYSVSLSTCRKVGRGFTVTSRPDVILFDCFSCGDNGRQVLDSIRRDPELDQVPVVICAVDADLLLEVEDWTQGDGIRLVRKPFDVQHLLDTVAEAAASGSRESHESR